jgi:predicted  nucleic acid-binding Zn-ribbon protein
MSLMPPLPDRDRKRSDHARRSPFALSLKQKDAKINELRRTVGALQHENSDHETTSRQLQKELQAANDRLKTCEAQIEIKS